MIRIHRNQMEALAEAEQLHLPKQISARFTEDYPREWKRRGSDGLLQFAQKAVKSALSFGISSERDIMRYADITFALLKDFGIEPTAEWIRTIMIDEQRSASQRINTLVTKHRRLLHIVDNGVVEFMFRALEGKS